MSDSADERGRFALVACAVLLGLYGDRGSLLPQPWGMAAELGTPWLLLVRHYGAPAWLVAGAAVGLLFGLLGATSRWRHSAVQRPAAWCVIAAVPLAEARRTLTWTYVPQHELLVVALVVVSALTVTWGLRTSAVRPAVLLVGTLPLAMVLSRVQDVWSQAL